MARASIFTLLSLDRYAKIMGINPVHFNGGNQIQLDAGATLFPLDNAQNNLWPQFAWQNSDMISREGLAGHIWNAEQDISAHLGYLVAPSWIEGDIYKFQKHYRPDVASAIGDSRYGEQGITLRYGNFIEGGRRKVDLIGTDDVNYFDVDTDTWEEVARIVVDMTDFEDVDLSEVKVYHVGYEGDREWEIREPNSMELVGTDLTIEFDTWKMIEPSVQDVLPTNEGKAIDLNDPPANANLVDSVEIYYEYNDVTQNAVEFIKINHITNENTMAGGFVFARDLDISHVIPVEGTYTDGAWARTFSTCLKADYLKLWYYAGYISKRYTLTALNDKMSEYLATTIAYLATARLERIFYANNNATALADSLRQDLALRVPGVSHILTRQAYNCPFGTISGEVKAWQRLKRFKRNMRGITL